MKLEATQSFTLLYPAKAGVVDETGALHFVRSPELALSRVRFLSSLQVLGEELRGVLVVKAPGLGEVDLPFVSQVVQTPDGAALEAQALADEQAWVAVDGQAHVNGAQMTFEFLFTAHIAVPDVPGWGGAAFEKMVRAAAQRTLRRVAETLPTDMDAALHSNFN